MSPGGTEVLLLMMMMIMIIMTMVSVARLGLKGACGPVWKV